MLSDAVLGTGCMCVCAAAGTQNEAVVMRKQTAELLSETRSNRSSSADRGTNCWSHYLSVWLALV